MYEFTDQQFLKFYEINSMWMHGNKVEIHDIIVTWTEFLKEQYTPFNTIFTNDIGYDTEEHC